MKKGIHPKYNEITVTMTDGEQVKMFSTSSKDITVDVDPKSHIAWTKTKSQTVSGGQADKFNKKFAAFGI